MKKFINKNVLFKSVLAFGLATATAVTVSSCTEDLLEQTNNNGTSTENFGSSIEQMQNALNAAYHPLGTIGGYARPIHIGAFLRSDEYNPEGNDGNTATAGLIHGEGERWGIEYWRGFYQIIARTNILLTTEIQGEDISTSDLNPVLGQAYFLRAFAYWNLVATFGNVPLVTDVPDLTELNVPQSTPAEVYAQIFEDLMKAEELLPVSWPEEDRGRATRGAATALLGKSYLYTEDWARAEEAFKRVVNSGTYGLLPLSQYGDNFSDTNENNMESLYEIQFTGTGTPVGNSWGFDKPASGFDGFFLIEYAAPNVSPDRGMYVNPWVRQLFERPENNTNTTRRNESIVYDNGEATGYAGVDFVTDYAQDIDDLTDRRDVNNLPNYQGVEAIFQKKYAGHQLADRASLAGSLGDTNGTNWRVIRYSDVLLMLAEALNEQGKTAEAVPFLNQVRTRAGLANTTATSEDAVRTAIIEERAMELFGEGHRYLDLVRWGLAERYLGATSEHVTNGDQANHPKSIIGGFFVPNKYEFNPIPTTELTANKQLNQNPGY